MVDPMTLTWSELIAEFVRRTGQEGVANPIKPEVKDLVSYARTLGLTCDRGSVTITDQAQVRQLLGAVPLITGMSIDFSDLEAPAPPPPKATSTTAAPVAAGTRLRCSATLADGSRQCKIEGEHLEVDVDGNPFCDIPKHHDQGNWSTPATARPVVMTDAEARARLQDIIDHQAGRHWMDLRREINPLLRQLEGFDEDTHSPEMGRVRNDMLALKVDPAKFRWSDVKKASKPKGTVKKASSGTSTTGPASGSKSPAKKSPSNKAAKKPKTSGSKAKKKATTKTPKPTATTAPNHKKGAGSAPTTIKSPTKGRKGTAMAVKTAADLERELADRKKKKGDVEDQALEYYKLWRRKKSEDDKAEVLELIQADKKAFKQLKPYLPQEMLDALDGVESGSGGTAKPGSKLPKGVDKATYDAAKARAQQLKDVDHKDRVEATMTLSVEGVDGNLINHVIPEVYN